MNPFELKNRLCIEDYRLVEEKLNGILRRIARDNELAKNELEDLRDELKRNSEVG